MKRISFCILALAGLLVYSSCKKQSATEEVTARPGDNMVTDAPPGALPCSNQYLNLAVDPSTGTSYLYMINNTLSSPPITITSVTGSAGNNIIGSVSPGPVDYMTGISYTVSFTGGTCYGITGAGGGYPNSLITFNLADPNVVTITALSSLSGTVLDLSDIERNPWNGLYYAINRTTNGLVTVDVNTGIVTDLPKVLGFPATGLATDCSGTIYLLSMSGANGDIYPASAVSGLAGVPCPYPGIIAPSAAGNAEVGLQYDCSCPNEFVTGNFDGSSIVLTVGWPGCSGPSSFYWLTPFGIKPTVDFSRL